MSALYEGILVEEERSQALVDVQRRVLDASSGRARAEAALRFGTRWATRHQNAELGAKLLEEALAHDPEFLRAREVLDRQTDADELRDTAERVIARARLAVRGAV